MIRTRCNQNTAKGQCKNVFRSRVKHDKCRTCYILNTGKSRPISSRILSENKYRRTRNRRSSVSSKPPVPKVIQNRNRNKNASLS